MQQKPLIKKRNKRNSMFTRKKSKVYLIEQGKIKIEGVYRIKYDYLLNKYVDSDELFPKKMGYKVNKRDIKYITNCANTLELPLRVASIDKKFSCFAKTVTTIFLVFIINFIIFGNIRMRIWTFIYIVLSFFAFFAVIHCFKENMVQRLCEEGVEELADALGDRGLQFDKEGVMVELGLRGLSVLVLDKEQVEGKKLDPMVQRGFSRSLSYRKYQAKNSYGFWGEGDYFDREQRIKDNYYNPPDSSYQDFEPRSTNTDAILHVDSVFRKECSNGEYAKIPKIGLLTQRVMGVDV